MISLTDHLLLAVVIVFLALTQVESGYRMKAWLLFAEFCAFIGLSVLMSDANPLWFDIFSAMGGVIFMSLFALIGAMYLGYLSCFIALYHLTTAFAFYHGLDNYLSYYYPIMLSICVLQLGGLLPGVLHGIRRVLYRRVLTDRRSVSRHHFVN